MTEREGFERRTGGGAFGGGRGIERETGGVAPYERETKREERARENAYVCVRI